MGYPVQIAFRYLGSKKRAFVSVGTAFAMLGVALGVAALSIVMSVTGGFQDQFREKVLGVNAHVIVLKYSVQFRDYRDVMQKVEQIPGVVAVAPFVINPMMVTHGDRTATGVLLKGVDPVAMPKVLDLPRHIVEGSLEGMRKAGAKPPETPRSDAFPSLGSSPTPPTTGSAAEPTEAGKQTLLEAIEKQIAEDKAKGTYAGLDAGSTDLATLIATGAADDMTKSPAPAASNRPAPPDPLDAILDEKPSAPTSAPTTMLPSGDSTPPGGFASTLPDDDVLPAEVDPDPCRSPEQVKALPGVVIGRTLAKRLAVGLGDCLQITSPQIGMSFGASGARPPIAKQFRVIAIFEAGFDQYDSKLVYTDLYEAQAFYEQGDSVTGVEAKVADIEQAAAVAKTVDKVLANGVFHTMDWRELNHGLFTALLIQQIAMSFVLTLIIVVAAFTVVATLIMVVLDKKKEIALLKALGASDDAILRVFVYQGGIIGVVGTVVGLLVGWLGCKALATYGFPLDPKVYFISKLPVNIRPTEFLITGAIAILICLVATILPALYAARLRPSDGLRAE
ncbi:Lipoprotein releasing system transmembrane protein LolC [Labilithrix luteola]|uniref:Lipoprotein releasing system transmembrane protein LolC n=1 Tax=Labilithrix luteola TaxID=1391654 RepID=A0A0K1Q1W8_9BACT|nr:ABC transporter permease [Labilithrix luteola]AKU99795.1 Lipoprotein releasing system transmembrane protein LolC [Labilithrix luteola]